MPATSAGAGRQRPAGHPKAGAAGDRKERTMPQYAAFIYASDVDPTKPEAAN